MATISNTGTGKKSPPYKQTKKYFRNSGAQRAMFFFSGSINNQFRVTDIHWKKNI